MIPYEVICIAEELGLYYKGSKEDGKEYYLDVAWQIYNRLQAEEKALLEGSY